MTTVSGQNGSSILVGTIADGRPRSNENGADSVEDENLEDDNVFTNNSSCPTSTATAEHSPSQNTPADSLGKVGDGEDEAETTTTSGVASSMSTVTVSTTRRRPSYTSKAPSALTNIGADETAASKVFDPTSLPRERLLQVPSAGEVSSFIVGHSSTSRATLNRQNASKEILHSLPSQASFEESIDEYSNPGTPCSLRNESPSASPNPGQKRSLDQRSRQLQAYANYKTKWEEAAKANVLIVKCRDTVAELYKSKLGSGSKGKSIKVSEEWKTPIEFEAFAGRGACKDWKRSIRFGGQPLQKLIEGGILTPHAISCTCGICCGDDTITGHVKLFVPYTKAKRRRKDMDSNRFSSSVESCEGSKGDGHILLHGRSVSCDSDVFTLPHQSSTATDNGDDIAAMPPMTPVTPITPITPLTPLSMGQSFPSGMASANGRRSSSPPRSITLAVPGSHTSAAMSYPVPSSILNASNGLSILANNRSSSLASDNGKSNSPAKDGSINVMPHHHWMQLEEVANNILSMANQLKILVAQAKLQAEASKEAAVAQARLQAENEKREVRDR